jgi:hypothetical protein
VHFDGCAPQCIPETGFHAYSNTPTSVCGDGIWAGAEVRFLF